MDSSKFTTKNFTSIGNEESFSDVAVTTKTVPVPTGGEGELLPVEDIPYPKTTKKVSVSEPVRVHLVDDDEDDSIGDDTLDTTVRPAASPVKEKAMTTAPDSGVSGGKRKAAGKRKVSGGSAPASKKQRTYASAASRALVLFVTNTPTGCMSDESAVHLQSYLESAMYESGSRVPRFRSHGLSRGMLRLDCDDEYAVQWVKSEVPLIPCSPDLPGTEWTWYSVDKLPRQHLAKLFIPGTTAKMSAAMKAEFLGMLGRSNPTLTRRTSSWRITFQAPQKATGSLLVGIQLDEASATYLSEHGWELFYKLGKLTVKPQSGCDDATSSSNPWRMAITTGKQSHL